VSGDALLVTKSVNRSVISVGYAEVHY